MTDSVTCPYCGHRKNIIDLKNIGTHLRQWRHDRGYTLADVCERAEITISHLSDIERLNRGASLETLAKLLEFYDIEFEYEPARIVMNGKIP